MAKRTAMFWTAAVLSVALLGCGVVWQISRAIAAGAPDGVANQTLSELQEKLRKAATIQERNEVIDAFRRLPGPDAQAAQILLDYLREKARTDAWGVTDALIKLMSEEQVARLAQDLRTYDEVNATAYLVPVLAARVNNVPTLSSVMLSLQAFPGYYDPFVALAWEKIFADSAQVVNWLDDLYARLADPMLRENLFEAVSRYTGEKLAGPRRAAAVAWLWRVQQQEENTSVRCRELLTLYKLGEAKALAALHEVYAGVTEARERAGIVYQAGSAARWELKGATQEELIGWLWQVARTEGAPFVRQSCLYTLYELGEEKALAALVEDIDRNGVAWLPDEHDRGVGPTIWWQWLKEVRDRYPQSYLARGIEAYERVRGQPYFAIEREEQEPGAWPPRFYGDDQYDPAREIPGWEKFLTAFSRHPAADDAAYRLARCYEIQGRWADALNALHKAFSLPDGDMRYHAGGRLVYVLDVRMNLSQLRELPSGSLEPSLRPLVEYTLAVKELRRDNFPEAAARLESFIAAHKGNEQFNAALARLSSILAPRTYDFWTGVTGQLARVRELAHLQEKWEKTRNPAVLYDLAAAVYHNQMLYYNHLWCGGRQGYNWLGYINASGYGHAPAEMAAFAREMINYNHGLRYFQQVYRDPASPDALKAKALYSGGLCYVGLDRWGSDAHFAFPPSEIREKVVGTYRHFLEEFPDGPLADGALLALGAYTGDPAYLHRLLKEYPQGEMAARARSLLKEMESPYYESVRLAGGPVPYDVLSAGNRIDALADAATIPQEVRKWAAANADHPFAGCKALGEWRYILVAAGPKPSAGYRVEIVNVEDDGRGTITVRYRIVNPAPGEVVATVITCPYILARIPAGNIPLEFEQAR